MVKQMVPPTALPMGMVTVMARAVVVVLVVAAHKKTRHSKRPGFIGLCFLLDAKARRESRSLKRHKKRLLPNPPQHYLLREYDG